MKHSPPIILTLLALFVLAQVIGLLVLKAYIDPAASEQTGTVVYYSLPAGIERPDVSAVGGPNYSFIFIGIAVAAGTLILLLIIRLHKFNLWRIWYLLSVILTLAIAWAAFVPQAIAGVAAVIAAILKVFKPNFIIHNLTELFIYSGLAAIFVPIINIFSGSILLILISLYDMYAVWKSKHMVSLAKFQTESNLFAGISVPKSMSLAGKPTKLPNTSSTADDQPVAIVGGGDIGFPLLFAGAVMAQYGFALSFLIPVFAVLGLAVLFFISQKGKFYPAMPFISAGCFVGYGIILML